MNDGTANGARKAGQALCSSKSIKLVFDVPKIPVVSLFSGAGGLDLGIEDAGGDVVSFLEPDADCAETLRRNRRFFPSSRGVIEGPVERFSTDQILASAGLRRNELALLVAGPPCQPFSKSGYWLQKRRKGVSDPRVALLGEFLRVLRRARPEAFILENVASLIHPTNRRIFDELLCSMQATGYATTWRLVHAVEYGVPQTRARIFVLGLKGKHPPKFPRQTHWWQPNGDHDVRGLRPPETAGRWIATLDREEFYEPGEIVQGRWANHLTRIPPGWNYKYLTAWAGYRKPSFITESRYWTFLLKLTPFRPSWTLQASPGPWTGPFHWSNRRLRVPEMAALQTFPATYVFIGDRTSRRRQIGNAVPSLLASRIAATLIEEVAGSRSRRGRRLRYNLIDEYHFRPGILRHRGPRW